MHWGEGRILNYPPPDVNIDVRARALGDVITVFFLVDHPRAAATTSFSSTPAAFSQTKPRQRWSYPPPPPKRPRQSRSRPPPKSWLSFNRQRRRPLRRRRPRRPHHCPPRRPPPRRPKTPSPTPTFTPTPVPTATWTPLPTVTPAGSARSLGDAQEQMIEMAQRYQPSSLLLLGLLSFGGASLFGGSLWWLRRRG